MRRRGGARRGAPVRAGYHATRARTRVAMAVVGLTAVLGTAALPGSHTADARAVRAPARATVLPERFADEVVWGVSNGLEQPVDLAFAPDGQIFVADKRGLVLRFDGPLDPRPTTFADLRDEVYSAQDHGLTSVAVDPEWPREPYVYVWYTLDAPPGGTPPVHRDRCPDPPGINGDGCVTSARVARLRADRGVMTGPEQVLVEGWCFQGSSHATGQLRFGPDGRLYVSGGDGAAYSYTDWGQRGIPRNPCGDPPSGVGVALRPPTTEGGSLRSQDVRTAADPTGLNGTVIRVDKRTGAAARTNPLHDRDDRQARRIIAFGLRQPWRFDFLPRTQAIVIGEVGHGRWEEINIVDDVDDARVENFGWPCYEGSRPQRNWDELDVHLCESLYRSRRATPPAFEYPHDASILPGEPCPAVAGAITAITAYDGSAFPPEYRRGVFFADYINQCLYFAPPDAAGRPDTGRLAVFGARFPTVNDLETGPAGDLWYVDSATCACIGRIHYEAAHAPPVARVRATPSFGPVPLRTRLDARASYDPDRGPLRYLWDLDADGVFADAFTPTVDLRYRRPRPVTARVLVVDDDGLSAVARVRLQPGNTPPAVRLTSSARAGVAVGDTVDFTVTANDAQDGPLRPRALSVRLVQHHCSAVTPDVCHAHEVGRVDGAAGGSFSAPDHDYPSHLTLVATARDRGGLERSTTLRIEPLTVALRVTSEPRGASVTVNSNTRHAPFTATVLRNSTVTLSAIDRMRMMGAAIPFVEWSNGGTRVQTFTAPAVPQRLTVRYDDRPVIGTTPTFATEHDGRIVFRLHLNRPGDEPVEVWWSIRPVTASVPGDVLPEDGLVRFAPGRTSVTVSARLRDDRIPERNELVVLRLLEATGGRVGLDADPVYGLIVDDD